MNVKISKILRLFTLILRLAKIFPPFPSVNIPVTVDFRSEQNSNAFCFERIFYYPDRAPYRFFSKMIPAGGDEMIEFMGLNIGWRTRFRCDGDKIHLDHRGYCIKIFDRIVMLPLEIFVGEGSAMEQTIDDNHFQMTMVLRHRLFGALYAYDGLFAMTDARR